MTQLGDSIGSQEELFWIETPEGDIKLVSDDGIEHLDVLVFLESEYTKDQLKAWAQSFIDALE